jgi:PKD repeat protein
MKTKKRFFNSDVFKLHKILGCCLLLVALFASTAHAQIEIPFNPGQVTECANQSTPFPLPGLPFDLVFTDNKTLTLGPGTLGFVLNGAGIIPFAGALLDAAGNVIPGTEYEGLADGDLTHLELSQSTTWHGMRFVSDFPTGSGVMVFVTCPVVGQSDTSGNQPPIAEAGAPVSGTVGAAVTFDGSGSSDPDGDIVQYDWDFGDGNTAMNGGPTPSNTYAVADTYNVTLTVTDDGELTNTDTTTATIGETGTPPTADAGGPYTGTVGVNVSFDGSGSSDPDGTIVLYNWDFDDGNTDSSSRPTTGNTYASSGSYTVTLTVTDDDGETAFDIAEVTIAEGNQSPIADAGPEVMGTVDVAVSFDGSGSSDPDGDIVQYDWDFGDGTSMEDAGPTPSYTYTLMGGYTVTVTVIDDGNATDSDFTIATIEATGAPTADAGGPYSGTAGVPVSFDGSASSDPDGKITAWNWEFGDSNVGSGPSPTHIYTTGGTYTVRLTVTDDVGSTDEDDTQVDIAAGNEPPTAAPNGPYSGVVGVVVNFDGSGSTDPDGDIVRYDWDFGDGNTAMNGGPTPSNTYARDGAYQVALTVTDDIGEKNTQTTAAAIDAASQPPEADAGGPYRGTVGVAVTFDGTASSDADGNIVRYDWDFGDGNTAPDGGPNPSNTYAAGSIYTVTLTVTDGDGVTSPEAFTTANIDSANEPPVADAKGPYAGKVDVPVDFDGTGSSDADGNIATYEWDFGDGTTDTGATPSHSYAVTDVYDVVLTVTDNDGDIAKTATQAVIGDGINLPPTADPGGPYRALPGVAVNFDGSGSSDADGNIVRYDWDFGDGNTAPDGGPNPSNTYAAEDYYLVTLTVTDNGATTDTRTTVAAIVANQPPVSDAGGPYAGPVSVPVQFSGLGSEDPDGFLVSYSWAFGDGKAGSGLFPTHTYAAPGLYTVTLTVTDNDGAENRSTATVLIGDGLSLPPTADANGPYTGVSNAPVTFDGTGSSDPDGDITAWNWYFGDGNRGGMGLFQATAGTGSTGTGPTVDKTYLVGGLYNVILQVIDDDGLPGSDNVTALIGDLSLPPTADANGPYNGRVGVALTFDGTASSDPDGTIARYDWAFGDGNIALDAGPTPSYTYPAGGKYIVKLTVTDDSGETDVDVTTATVGIGNLPPQADAGDSVSVKVRRDITFDGTDSSDPDGNIVSYAWEFGDGNTGTGPRPTHRYAGNSKYLVTLTVTDNDGATSSDVTLADVEKGGNGGGGDGLCFINTVMGK